MQIATFAAGCFWGVEEAFRTLPGVKETVVEKSKIALEKSGKWKNPIVTEIIPAGTFYHAEEYHQQYLVKRGIGSCHI